MPVVKRYSFIPGAKLISNQLNTNFDDIYNTFNAHQHTGQGNDANQITSSGIAAGAVQSTNFIVQSYTPTVNYGTGGTGYYINLGGIKMAWGTTNGVASSANNMLLTISMPTSFFNSITSVNAQMNPANYVEQWCNVGAVSTTTLQVYLHNQAAGTVYFNNTYWQIWGT